jgi:molybdopterin/thiamine biosynthesis adenylyltransferase
VTDRQEKLTGFDQEALATARVLLIGAGGLGGEIGEALVRKGVGKLAIYDFDRVDLTNLNRQLFRAQDVGKPKAHRLAANLATMGFCRTHIQGIAVSFQDALQQGIDVTGNVSVVVCGVDNNPCRITVSRHYQFHESIPL